MRDVLMVSRGTGRKLSQLAEKFQMDNISVLRLAISIGLRELSNGAKPPKVVEKYPVDLGDLDPYHAIETAAGEVLFHEARQKSGGFYMARKEDVVRILGPALSIGVSVLDRVSGNLLEFVCENYWTTLRT